MVDFIKSLSGIQRSEIHRYAIRYSFNKNMSISVQWCFLNLNWLTHVVQKVETLDNIKDSNNLLAIVARAMGR